MNTPNPNPSPELIAAGLKEAIARVKAAARYTAIGDGYFDPYANHVEAVDAAVDTLAALLPSAPVDGEKEACCPCDPDDPDDPQQHDISCAQCLSTLSPQTLPAPGEVERLRAGLSEIDRINGGADWNGTRTIARNALATVAAANDEGVAFVAGPIWQETEEEQECWTAEIQSVGGHNVIATVHGASRDEASQRQSAVMHALATSGSQHEGAGR